MQQARGNIFSDIMLIFKKEYIYSIFLLAKVSLKNKYHGSFLGMIWSLVQPITFIIVMSIAFSYIMKFSTKSNQPYILYLMSGSLAWNVLTRSCLDGAGSLIFREGVLKSCSLPRTMFILADISVHFYTYIISFIPTYIIIVLLGADFSWYVLLLPFAMLPLAITSMALGILFGYISPYVKDVRHILDVALQAIFWLTPIMYPDTIVPAELHWLLNINPFYFLINPIQQVVFYNQIPSPEIITYACFTAVFAVLISYLGYKSLRKNVIYYL